MTTHPQFVATGPNTLGIGGHFTREQFFNLMVETFYFRADRTAAREFGPIALDLPQGSQVRPGLTNADWFTIFLIKNIEEVFGNTATLEKDSWRDLAQSLEVLLSVGDQAATIAG